MELSSELISQFAKLTTSEDKSSKESTVYGTVKIYENKKYVQLDGSELLTPIQSDTDQLYSTAYLEDGDRVTATIKNHTLTVTGNTSVPANTYKDSSTGELVPTSGKISDFEIVVADMVTTDYVDAKFADIDTLIADNASIKNLEADIIETNVLIAEEIAARKAAIEELEAGQITTDDLDAKYATIDSLRATDASIENLRSDYANIEDLTAEKFTAIDASIEKLEAGQITVDDLDVKYANIDFANITEAAIERIFSDTGIIKDLIVSEGTITGELVGVTIKGDLIEANTLKADKLVVKGSDGIYYKLNIEAGAVESAEVSKEELQNGLHGSTIIANTITAEKIRVDDLVAFGATIGGFNITNNAIYSGVKESAINTTRGIYFDNEGQLSVGDSNNYLRYFKDSDGKYKLEISAGSVRIRTSSDSGDSGETSQTIEEALNNMQSDINNVQTNINNVQSDIDSLRDEITTLLRIESSRGTVFKNDSVSTVLSVVIYHGTQRITDSATMKSVFGNSAYIQWHWQRLDDSNFGIISADDKRIGDNGFTFTLSPEDVDTKVTFMCELIV